MNERGTKWAELSLGETFERIMIRSMAQDKRRGRWRLLIPIGVGACLFLIGWTWLIVNLCWVAFGN